MFWTIAVIGKIVKYLFDQSKRPVANSSNLLFARADLCTFKSADLYHLSVLYLDMQNCVVCLIKDNTTHNFYATNWVVIVYVPRVVKNDFCHCSDYGPIIVNTTLPC